MASRIASENSTFYTHLHGCVIVSGGRVISTGVNKSRLRNSYVYWWDEEKPPSEHAEVAALRKCSDIDLSNATIYVSRVNRRGKEMMSRPCTDCQKAIADAGIKKIVYTTNNQMEMT